jgi:hypothetical protein
VGESGNEVASDTNVEEGSPADLPACNDGSADSGGCAGCMLFSDALDPPTGEIVDGVVRLTPDGLQFGLSPEILRHVDDPDYVFLSATELPLAEHGVGEWNEDYAAILNGLLSYSRCGAHVGTNEWPDGIGWIGIYLRAYVVEESTDSLEQRVHCLAPSLVEMAGGTFDSIETSELAGWRRTRVRYTVIYGDYGGFANIDVFAHDFCGGTAVLAFMYPDTPLLAAESDITAIMTSACAMDPASGACCFP